MKTNKLKHLVSGAAGDSVLFMAVRVVTILVTFVVTRMLSDWFSVSEYGTYSQIMLIVSTVSNVTILGMMDGINFFYGREKDFVKREKYIATIFAIHAIVSALTSTLILLLTVPISQYFKNADLKGLIVFAALLPILQNTISMLQILFISVGKAKTIAFRNLLVSFAKLLFVLTSCYLFNNIIIVLIAHLFIDTIQTIYFFIVLKKNDVNINIFKSDFSLAREIITYCVPMAMYTILNSINRDCDKYIISAFTSTEELAIYSNASKLLPFDIVMTSLCTILLPYITKYISNREYKQTVDLYKVFLELSYTSTGILAAGALCVAPELMRFLYTEKYLAGINVFCIYLIVDTIRFLNITLIMSASGRTKTIMYVSLGTFVTNIVLNILFFRWLGFEGPAIATLFITFVNGIIILGLSAKALETTIWKMFDWKYFVCFWSEVFAVTLIVSLFKKILVMLGFNYIINLIVCYFVFALIMLVINYKRVSKDIGFISVQKHPN